MGTTTDLEVKIREDPLFLIKWDCGCGQGRYQIWWLWILLKLNLITYYVRVLFTWLYNFRKNEEEAKKRLLDNPIKLQQLQQVSMFGCGLWLSWILHWFCLVKIIQKSKSKKKHKNKGEKKKSKKSRHRHDDTSSDESDRWVQYNWSCDYHMTHLQQRWQSQA